MSCAEGGHEQSSNLCFCLYDFLAKDISWNSFGKTKLIFLVSISNSRIRSHHIPLLLKWVLFHFGCAKCKGSLIPDMSIQY